MLNKKTTYILKSILLLLLISLNLTLISNLFARPYVTLAQYDDGENCCICSDWICCDASCNDQYKVECCSNTTTGLAICDAEDRDCHPVPKNCPDSSNECNDVNDCSWSDELPCGIPKPSYCWCTEVCGSYPVESVDAYCTADGTCKYECNPCIIEDPEPEPECGNPEVSCGCDNNMNFTVAWSAVSGADYYPVRIDDEIVAWDGTCPLYESPFGDVCTNHDEIPNTQFSYTGTGIANHNYHVWVHAYDTGCSDAWRTGGHAWCSCPSGNASNLMGRVFSIEDNVGVGTTWNWRPGSGNECSTSPCPGSSCHIDGDDEMNLFCVNSIGHNADWSCNGGGAFYYQLGFYEGDVLDCYLTYIPTGYACISPSSCSIEDFTLGPMDTNHQQWKIGRNYCPSLSVSSSSISPGDAVTLTAYLNIPNNDISNVNYVRYHYTSVRADGNYCGLSECIPGSCDPDIHWIRIGDTLGSSIIGCPSNCRTEYNWTTPTSLDGDYVVVGSIYGLDAWCTGNPSGSCGSSMLDCYDCGNTIDISCTDEPPTGGSVTRYPCNTDSSTGQTCCRMDVSSSDLTNTIEWTAPTDWGNNCGTASNRYVVQIDNNSDFSSPIYNSGCITNTRIPSNVSLGSCTASSCTYYYRVFATNDGTVCTVPDAAHARLLGSGSFVRRNIAAAAPTNPSPADGSDPGSTSVALDWSEPVHWGCNLTASDRRNHYATWLSPNDSTFTTDDLIDGSCVGYTCTGVICINLGSSQSLCSPITDLTWGVPYYWRVRACNSDSLDAYDPFNSLRCSQAVWSFTSLPNHWWQTAGGDIYADANITSTIPSTATNRFLMGNWNYSTNNFDAGLTQAHGIAMAQTIGAFETGVTLAQSGSQWQITGNEHIYDGGTYDYAWWVNHLIDETKYTYSGGALPNPGITRVYNAPNASINMSGTIASGSKVIILHQGASNTITINGNITVNQGGFLLVISQGNIIINAGRKGSAAAPSVQGIFIADGYLRVGNNTDVGITDQFWGAGSFISWSDIELLRDIGGTTSVSNPSMIFIFRPDFIINAPDIVKTIYFPKWQQVRG
jgi:hypothetical protein